MTALTPSRMRRLISSLVNLLSSSRSILPSMLNPQNTRHYLWVMRISGAKVTNMKSSCFLPLSRGS
jgi:hypothetical protein